MTTCTTSDGTNQYFDVIFESAIRVICSFHGPPGNQIQRNKSCSVAYGSCQQASATIMTAQNMTSSSSSIVVINLQSPLSNGNCYTVTASSDASSTTKIQGTFSIRKYSYLTIHLYHAWLSCYVYYYDTSY